MNWNCSLTLTRGVETERGREEEGKEGEKEKKSDESSGEKYCFPHPRKSLFLQLATVNHGTVVKLFSKSQLSAGTLEERMLQMC